MKLFYKIQAWKKKVTSEMVNKSAFDAATGTKRYWKAKERVIVWEQAGSIVGYAFDHELPEEVEKYAIERSRQFIGNMIRLEIWAGDEVIKTFCNYYYNGKQWIKKRLKK